jgi:hypothetical protein
MYMLYCLALLTPIGEIGFVSIPLLLTIVVTGLLKPNTKTDVGTGLVTNDVSLKTRNEDVLCRVEIPRIHYQDQKYSNENIGTELMKQ